MATKKIFIVPAFIFFVLYYFALPVLVGYAPQFMSTKVLYVNLAYLFALSQFLSPGLSPDSTSKPPIILTD